MLISPAKKFLGVSPAAPQNTANDSQGVDFVALKGDRRIALIGAEQNHQPGADLNALDLNAVREANDIEVVVRDLVLALVDENVVAGSSSGDMLSPMTSMATMRPGLPFLLSQERSKGISSTILSPSSKEPPPAHALAATLGTSRVFVCSFWYIGPVPVFSQTGLTPMAAAMVNPQDLGTPLPLAMVMAAGSMPSRAASSFWVEMPVVLATRWKKSSNFMCAQLTKVNLMSNLFSNSPQCERRSKYV